MSPVQRLAPVEHRTLRTGNVLIHFAELPTEKRPLVLLHGIGMDWRVWQGVSRRLAAHFHLFMVDLRGHGASEKPDRGYTLGHYAADIEDLVDSLGLKNAALVGSSLGGMVAIAVEAPPDLVSHRVLVDPPLTGGPVRDEESLRRLLQLKHRPVGEMVEYLRELNPGAGNHLLQTMAAMWHEAADGVIDDVLSAPNTYFDVDAALTADESQTLIMRADPSLGGVLRPGQAERTLSLLPHGHLVDVPGAGHAIHAYKPAYFARALDEFVEQGRVLELQQAEMAT